jgi:L-lactate dehydrogenase (cytochrome)
VLNLHDFETMAKSILVGSGRKQAWDNYSSGAADELTISENVGAFRRLWLKPRVLVDVKDVDTTCTILGTPSPLPLFLSAVAMCGMGHTDGELAWVRAAADTGVIFMVPNFSSRSFDEVLAARQPGQTVHFQMYVNPDRAVVQEQIRACERHGVKAIP